ncbi:MAG: V-type ATP synthase subunit C [Finegoldia sp.]|nr:V-type ATP synthase subunit C [Finegoldia sp.]
MKNEDFIYQSSTTRVKEKNLLKRQDYERLIDSNDLEELIRLLSDTVYHSELSKLDNPKLYDKALSKELENTYKYFYEMSDSVLPVKFLAVQYDYHNLKVLIKEYLKGEDLSYMLSDISDIDPEEIRKVLNSDDFKLENEHYQKVIDESLEDFENNHDPQMIDIYADREYFVELKEIVDQMNSKLLKEYVEDLIDFTNVQTLLRAQKQGKDLEFLEKVIIDGGTIEKDAYSNYLFTELDEDSPLFTSSRIYYRLKDAIKSYKMTSSLSEFEKQKDDYLMNKIKEIRKITYGPEVITGYLFAKETEIKNLRIIFVGKINSLDPDFIRGKLRLGYA